MRKGAKPLLAHHPIPVPIPHVPVGRMRPRHRSNPVSAGLRAGDPAVAIVVVARERIAPTPRCGSGAGPGGSRHGADDRLERRALAAGEDALERRRFAPVDRKSVGLTHVDDPPREPTPIPDRDPLRRILPALLVPVHLGRREREVAEVTREPGPGFGVRGTQAGIVRLNRSDRVPRCPSRTSIRSTAPCRARTRRQGHEQCRARPTGDRDSHASCRTAHNGARGRP